MRKAIVLGCVLVAALVVPAVGAGSAGPPSVLEFDTMAAVVAPYTGSANPIRGVNGGGLPWQIDEAKGELRTDGRLEIEVEGLVLLDGAPVPESLRGTNPIDSFRAVVSCRGIDGGVATTPSVTTDASPATPAGDARIEATIALPNPCFAPIVFVTSPTGAWFAVTGV